jgi:hypothetical protein
VERFSDDSANVILAEDGWMEMWVITLPPNVHEPAQLFSRQSGLQATFCSGSSRGCRGRNHLAKLLAGGDMADPDLAQMRKVEQGQPLGEQLAIDDPLAKARDDPEADAPRKLVESRADPAQIVRIDVLEAVAKTTQSTLLPVALARWVRLFQISSA